MKKISAILFVLMAAGVYAQQNASSAPDMVRINAGTFKMGSLGLEYEPGRYDHEGPQGDVTVSAFSMGKHEVTQKEYEEVTGTNPAVTKGENLPAVNVSWYNAIEYCNLLSQREGLKPAYAIDKSRSDSNNRNTEDDVKWVVTWDRGANGYRLPTEAEWEYACRAGTTTYFSTGDNITTGQANYDGTKPYNNNAAGEFRRKTTPVGSFAPNPWGLFDMHGNVWEWCWDWYNNSARSRRGLYPSGARTNPEGESSGVGRIIRGGSWFDDGNSMRSAFRGDNIPSERAAHLGFRLVRN